jgi:hypothetical protein
MEWEREKNNFSPLPYNHIYKEQNLLAAAAR